MSGSATAAPYLPPAGYQRTPQSFIGDQSFNTGAFAIAPDGKVAVATSNSAGGGTIKVYGDVDAAQAASSPIRTFADPAYKYWGDLTFTDNDTLLFTENGGTNAQDAVYRGTISTGATTTLGNVPAAGGVAVSGNKTYVVSATGFGGAGAVYEIVGNATPAPVITNIGTGLLTGIAVDAGGNLLVTDTNDPNFVGNAGKLLRFSSTFAPLPEISLAGGNGTGAYDLILDGDNDVFVTTGATLTRIPDGVGPAEQFGGSFGNFAFTSNLDFHGGAFEPFNGTGTLWVNAVFGDDGAVIGIQTPEPVGLTLLALATVALTRRRRAAAVTLAASLAAFTSVSFIDGARADQFFATQVISRTIGTQQQPGFTDPAYALGAPRGGGTTTNSLHAYALGNGGSITLGFDVPGGAGGEANRGIFNGPGADFLVAENSFLQDEDPHRAFAELVRVEVSTDGVRFAKFPYWSRTPSPVGAFGVIDPDDTKSFAGVQPVFANADENDIDPFDPAAAGGDRFDLSTIVMDPFVLSGAVDLNKIRYVRLIDVIGDGSAFDTSGQPIFDPTGVGIGGADVDAVTVIHGTTTPEPAGAAGALAVIYLALRRS